jgi:signal transduction histidine kinase/membrane protease YdiL (CAAX protease family)/predicted nucleotidyltransferase
LAEKPSHITEKRVRSLSARARRAVRPVFCLALSFVFFHSSVLTPYAAEAEFWSQRREAAQKLKEKPSLADSVPALGLTAAEGARAGLSAEQYQLLAQLPKATNFDFGVTENVSLGSLAEPGTRLKGADLSAPPKRSEPQDATPTWLSTLVLPYGSIRDIHLSRTSSAPLIIHIQDAHEIEEAQKNMAAMIRGLREERGVSLVGLEGARGAFNVDPYRGFPDESVTRGIADQFLKAGYIGGPEHAALTAQEPPLLWGLEDLSLYESNIQSFKDSIRFKPQVQAFIGGARSTLAGLKEKAYSRELKEFDRHFEAHKSRQESLGAYVRYLMTAYEGSGRGFLNLHLLLDALTWEETLDFKRVEKERLELVELLAKRLPEEQLSLVVQQSLLYRLGRMSYGDYHRFLRKLCRDNKVDLDQFSQLNSYVTYVLLAEQINRNELLIELSNLEGAAQASLARTPEQKKIAELNRHLMLLEKLTSHSMTQADWYYYYSRRADILALGAGLAAVARGLGAETPPAPEDLAAVIRPFEEFCEYAMRRNAGLVDNLLSKMQERSAPTAILVAGGFHSDGLTQILRQKDASYVVITPKIQKVPKDSHYLDVFARDPLPLEKLFSGEVINLKFPLRLAASQPEGFAPASAQMQAWFAAEQTGLVLQKTVQAAEERAGPGLRAALEPAIDRLVESARGFGLDLKLDASDVEVLLGDTVVVEAELTSADAPEVRLRMAVTDASKVDQIKEFLDKEGDAYVDSVQVGDKSVLFYQSGQPVLARLLKRLRALLDSGKKASSATDASELNALVRRSSAIGEGVEAFVYSWGARAVRVTKELDAALREGKARLTGVEFREEQPDLMGMTNVARVIGRASVEPAEPGAALPAGEVTVLTLQPGEPLGRPGRLEEDLARAAQAPQEAYDELIRTVAAVNERGHVLDFGAIGNVLLESVSGLPARFHLVDIGKPTAGMNTLANIALPFVAMAAEAGRRDSPELTDVLRKLFAAAVRYNESADNKAAGREFPLFADPEMDYRVELGIYGSVLQAVHLSGEELNALVDGARSQVPAPSAAPAPERTGLKEKLLLSLNWVNIAVYVGIGYLFRDVLWHGLKEFVFSPELWAVAALVFGVKIALNTLVLKGIKSPAAKSGVLAKATNRFVEGAPRWVVFTSVAVLAPLVEEIVFRGIAIYAIGSFLGGTVPVMGLGEVVWGWQAAAAVFASSAAFSLVHLRGQWRASLSDFLSGLAYGFAYLLTGSLIVPIAIHIASNSRALLRKFSADRRPPAEAAGLMGLMGTKNTWAAGVVQGLVDPAANLGGREMSKRFSEEVRRKITEVLAEVEKRKPAGARYAFLLTGSLARDEGAGDSDIDFLVVHDGSPVSKSFVRALDSAGGPLIGPLSDLGLKAALIPRAVVFEKGVPRTDEERRRIYFGEAGLPGMTPASRRHMYDLHFESGWGDADLAGQMLEFRKLAAGDESLAGQSLFDTAEDLAKIYVGDAKAMVRPFQWLAYWMRIHTSSLDWRAGAGDAGIFAAAADRLVLTGELTVGERQVLLDAYDALLKTRMLKGAPGLTDARREAMEKFQAAKPLLAGMAALGPVNARALRRFARRFPQYARGTAVSALRHELERLPLESRLSEDARRAQGEEWTRLLAQLQASGLQGRRLEELAAEFGNDPLGEGAVSATGRTAREDVDAAIRSMKWPDGVPPGLGTVLYGRGGWMADPFLGAPLWETVFFLPTVLAGGLGLDLPWLLVIGLGQAAAFSLAHGGRPMGQRLALFGLGLALGAAAALPAIWVGGAFGLVSGAALNVLAHAGYNLGVSGAAERMRRLEELRELSEQLGLDLAAETFRGGPALRWAAAAPTASVFGRFGNFIGGLMSWLGFGRTGQREEIVAASDGTTARLQELLEGLPTVGTLASMRGAYEDLLRQGAGRNLSRDFGELLDRNPVWREGMAEIIRRQADDIRQRPASWTRDLVAAEQMEIRPIELPRIEFRRFEPLQDLRTLFGSEKIRGPPASKVRDDFASRIPRVSDVLPGLLDRQAPKSSLAGSFSSDTTLGLELEATVRDQFGAMGLSDKRGAPFTPGNARDTAKEFRKEDRDAYMHAVAVAMEELNRALEDSPHVVPGTRWQIADQKTNFFELSTPAFFATDEGLRLFKAQLEYVQTYILPGGIYSMHQNIGRKSLSRGAHLDIDESRLARVVLTFQSMLRALAGYGYSAVSTGYVKAPGVDGRIEGQPGVDFIKAQFRDHGLMINLAEFSFHTPRPTLESKIGTGMLKAIPGVAGPGRLDLERFDEEMHWLFRLLDVAAEKSDAAAGRPERLPLAKLGIPVASGSKPSRAQIKAFIDMFFEGDPVGAEIARKVLLEDLAQERPGADSEVRRRTEKDIRGAFTAFGLSEVYDAHKAADGIERNISRALLARNAVPKLAADLLRVGTSVEAALAYFPAETEEDRAFRDTLREAMESLPVPAQTADPEVKIEYLGLFQDRSSLDFLRSLRESDPGEALPPALLRIADRKGEETVRLSELRYADEFRRILERPADQADRWRDLEGLFGRVEALPAALEPERFQRIIDAGERFNQRIELYQARIEPLRFDPSLFQLKLGPLWLFGAPFIPRFAVRGLWAAHVALGRAWNAFRRASLYRVDVNAIMLLIFGLTFPGSIFGSFLVRLSGASDAVAGAILLGGALVSLVAMLVFTLTAVRGDESEPSAAREQPLLGALANFATGAVFLVAPVLLGAAGVLEAVGISPGFGGYMALWLFSLPGLYKALGAVSRFFQRLGRGDDDVVHAEMYPTPEGPRRGEFGPEQASAKAAELRGEGKAESLTISVKRPRGPPENVPVLIDLSIPEEFRLEIRDHLERLLERASDEDLGVLGETLEAQKAAGLAPGLAVAALERSQNVFEDHSGNGLIGINLAYFDGYGRDYTDTDLSIGLAHEIRHELMVAEREVLAERKGVHEGSLARADVLEYLRGLSRGEVESFRIEVERRQELLDKALLEALTGASPGVLAEAEEALSKLPEVLEAKRKVRAAAIVNPAAPLRIQAGEILWRVEMNPRRLSEWKAKEESGRPGFFQNALRGAMLAGLLQANGMENSELTAPALSALSAEAVEDLYADGLSPEQIGAYLRGVYNLMRAAKREWAPTPLAARVDMRTAERIVERWSGVAHEVGNFITPLAARAQMTGAPRSPAYALLKSLQLAMHLLSLDLKDMKRKELSPRDKIEFARRVILFREASLQLSGAWRAMHKDSARHEENLQAVQSVLELVAVDERRVETAPLSLSSIVNSAERVADLDAKGVGVEINVPEDLPRVNVSLHQMLQVLVNMMHNAADAMQGQASRRLVISAHYDDQAGQAVLSLRDNGAGIPEELLGRVFEPGFTTKQEIGDGIGLSISKKIIESYSGTIEVRSGEGQGTEFVIRLPVLLEAAERPEERPLRTGGEALPEISGKPQADFDALVLRAGGGLTLDGLMAVAATMPSLGPIKTSESAGRTFVTVGDRLFVFHAKYRGAVRLHYWMSVDRQRFTDVDDGYVPAIQRVLTNPDFVSQTLENIFGPGSAAPVGGLRVSRLQHGSQKLVYRVDAVDPSGAPLATPSGAPYTFVLKMARKPGENSFKDFEIMRLRVLGGAGLTPAFGDYFKDTSHAEAYTEQFVEGVPTDHRSVDWNASTIREVVRTWMGTAIALTDVDRDSGRVRAKGNYIAVDDMQRANIMWIRESGKLRGPPIVVDLGNMVEKTPTAFFLELRHYMTNKNGEVAEPEHIVAIIEGIFDAFRQRGREEEGRAFLKAVASSALGPGSFKMRPAEAAKVGPIAKDAIASVLSRPASPLSVLDPALRALVRGARDRGWERAAAALDAGRVAYNSFGAPFAETLVFLHLAAPLGLGWLVGIGLAGFLAAHVVMEAVFDRAPPQRALARALWSMVFLAPYLFAFGLEFLSPWAAFGVSSGLHVAHNLLNARVLPAYRPVEQRLAPAPETAPAAEDWVRRSRETVAERFPSDGPGPKVYYYAIGGGMVAAGRQPIDLVSPLESTDFGSLIGTDIGGRGGAAGFERMVRDQLSGRFGDRFGDLSTIESTTLEGYPAFRFSFTLDGRRRSVEVLYEYDAMADAPAALDGGFDVLYSRGFEAGFDRMMKDSVRRDLLAKTRDFAILGRPDSNRVRAGDRELAEAGFDRRLATASRAMPRGFRFDLFVKPAAARGGHDLLRLAEAAGTTVESPAASVDVFAVVAWLSAGMWRVLRRAGRALRPSRRAPADGPLSGLEADLADLRADLSRATTSESIENTVAAFEKRVHIWMRSGRARGYGYNAAARALNELLIPRGHLVYFDAGAYGTRAFAVFRMVRPSETRRTDEGLVDVHFVEQVTAGVGERVTRCGGWKQADEEGYVAINVGLISRMNSAVRTLLEREVPSDGEVGDSAAAKEELRGRRIAQAALRKAMGALSDGERGELRVSVLVSHEVEHERRIRRLGHPSTGGLDIELEESLAELRSMAEAEPFYPLANLLYGAVMGEKQDWGILARLTGRSPEDHGAILSELETYLALSEGEAKARAAEAYLRTEKEWTRRYEGRLADARTAAAGLLGELLYGGPEATRSLQLSEIVTSLEALAENARSRSVVDREEADRVMRRVLGDSWKGLGAGAAAESLFREMAARHKRAASLATELGFAGKLDIESGIPLRTKQADLRLAAAVVLKSLGAAGFRSALALGVRAYNEAMHALDARAEARSARMPADAAAAASTLVELPEALLSDAAPDDVARTALTTLEEVLARADEVADGRSVFGMLYGPAFRDLGDEQVWSRLSRHLSRAARESLARNRGKIKLLRAEERIRVERLLKELKPQGVSQLDIFAASADHWDLSGVESAVRLLIMLAGDVVTDATAAIGEEIEQITYIRIQA